MCHPPYGPGVSEQTFVPPTIQPEAPAHFHVLENGSIWKFRDKQGRFCKPYRQRVKVCVVCEEIWENSAKEAET